jgi:hypothetical protein
LLIFGGRDIDHIFICGQWKTDLVENPPESKTDAKYKLEKIPFKRMAKMIGLSSMASLLEHRVAQPNSFLIGFEQNYIIKSPP